MTNPTGDVRAAAAQRQERAVATTENGAGDQLAIRTDQADWTPRQLAALEAMGVQNAPGPELSVFLHVSRTTGLNPFRKQIYMIGRYSTREKKTLWTIQTSIDGFRIIRDRAAHDAGVTASYEDPVWYELAGGRLREHLVWTPGAGNPPFACKWVTLKIGPDGTLLGRYPKVIRFEAYVDTDSSGKRRNRWLNDPDGMIAKCAEAGSLREAFPEDLGGLYIEEEMEADQAAPGRRRRPNSNPEPPVTTATVVPPGEETGQGETLEGVVREKGNAVDADLDAARKKALAGIHAIFTEHEWGGESEEAKRVRRGVAANLGREEGEPPLAIADLSALNAFQAQRVLERLAAMKARDMKATLKRMAQAAEREAKDQGGQ